MAEEDDLEGALNRVVRLFFGIWSLLYTGLPSFFRPSNLPIWQTSFQRRQTVDLQPTTRRS